jgi:hypothetical protein
VRAWARRRLRNAVEEVLKARGYNANGIMVQSKTAQGKPLDLKGSLRLHVQTPLIPARFEEVKAEVHKIIDVMIQAVNAESSTTGPSESKMRPQRNSGQRVDTKKKHALQR